MLIREGGSIPIVQAFRDILGVDTLLLGLALSDAQIHSPNENFPIANFDAGIKLNQALLEELAKQESVGDIIEPPRRQVRQGETFQMVGNQVF